MCVGPTSRDSTLIGLGCGQALTFVKCSPVGSNVRPRTTVLELGNPPHSFSEQTVPLLLQKSLKQDVFCRTPAAPERDG